MILSPDHWADVMRWWAVIGSLFGALPLVRRLRPLVQMRILGGRADVPVPQLPLIFGGLALLCFQFFSMVAGLTLPLTSRVPGFGLDQLAVHEILAGAWTSAGIGAWLTAVAFSRGRPWIAGMAVSWFFAVWFATIATAGG